MFRGEAVLGDRIVCFQVLFAVASRNFFLSMNENEKVH